MYLRPGITIQHTRERSPDSDVVRSDITGFIGVIRSDKWPEGAKLGDFVEIPLSNWADFEASPFRDVFDPPSVRAVQSFFENGGERCHLFGVYLSALQDLMARDPFPRFFFAVMERLRTQEDLGLVAMPVLAHLPVHVGPEGVLFAGEGALELLLNHCREMNNRFLIIDAPKDLHGEPLLQWVNAFRERHRESASFGAVYYPWLLNGEESFAPSGSVAGVFSRIERASQPFGVRQPPANQVLHGVTHPSVEVSWRDTGMYLGNHINLAIAQPTRGVVVWGARTLSLDAQWMHINSRRIVSMISEQLRRDNEWVVFENQRPQLWDVVSRSVRSRLDSVWSAGLLTGQKAGLDYLVKCDAETNPLEVRDAGQLHVEVTLRPISTTEFIVLDLRLGS